MHNALFLFEWHVFLLLPMCNAQFLRVWPSLSFGKPKVYHIDITYGQCKLISSLFTTHPSSAYERNMHITLNVNETPLPEKKRKEKAIYYDFIK